MLQDKNLVFSAAQVITADAVSDNVVEDDARSMWMNQRLKESGDPDLMPVEVQNNDSRGYRNLVDPNFTTPKLGTAPPSLNNKVEEPPNWLKNYLGKKP